MALYYLYQGHVTRPRSSVDASAYRAGVELEHDGKIYDYTARDDIIYSEIILSENSPPEFSDRQTFWLAAEKAEDASTRRKTARTAHEIILAFPRELTFDTSIVMVKKLITKCFVSRGICVDLNVHRGDAKDIGHLEADHKEIPPHNPHCHLLYPTRYVTREGFSKYKAREWESWGNSEFLIQLRKEWADIQNRMFERKGLTVRVSHERTDKRDIDREYGKNEYNRREHGRSR